MGEEPGVRRRKKPGVRWAGVRWEIVAAEVMYR